MVDAVRSSVPPTAGFVPCHRMIDISMQACMECACCICKVLKHRKASQQCLGSLLTAGVRVRTCCYALVLPACQDDRPVWQQLQDRLDKSPELAPGRLERHKQDSAQLQQQVAQLQQQVVGLEQQNMGLQQQVADAQQEIARLQQQAAGLQQRLRAAGLSQA